MRGKVVFAEGWGKDHSGNGGFCARGLTMLLALSGLLMAPGAHALPFGAFDARTLAMGGVGVATGSRYAAFNNPALLTTAEEIHEWFMLLPTAGRQLSDPDAVEDGLTAFQDAADTLAASPSPANAAAVQTGLDGLADKQYRYGHNTAVMLAIPSRILSGAAFVNVYGSSTARPVIGGDDLSDPANPVYNSTLEQRGVRVLENGFSAAMLLDDEKGWLKDVAIGFSAKFLLVEGYGYSDPLRLAEVDIDRSGRKNGAQFAFDVGMIKEIGVWKLALTAKNLVPSHYHYGTSGDDFRLEPQVRAGFAYKSRRSVLELDLDLTENAPVGADSASQIAALGWEWQPWRWFSLRAGVSQNLAGTQASYGSLGLGVLMGVVYIDVAGYTGDEGDGVAAQLGLQF
jgi:hypothetical protein